MARHLLLAAAVLVFAGCETSGPAMPKLPSATETNVHRSPCGDPNGDAAGIPDSGICEEDAGTPPQTCTMDSECPSHECMSTGICME